MKVLKKDNEQIAVWRLKAVGVKAQWFGENLISLTSTMKTNPTDYLQKLGTQFSAFSRWPRCMLALKKLETFGLPLEF